MKIDPLVENNSQTEISPAFPGSGPQFEHLLEWARFGSAHTRKNLPCVEKHRQNLRASIEAEKCLVEFDHWRESTMFTDLEKAVLILSEIISLDEPGKLSPQILEDARRHFSPEEIVRLTLTIMAVNDWIDLQQ